MRGDRPTGVRVDFDDATPSLPLDVRWEGFDAEGLALWVALCSPPVLERLLDGSASLHLDVLPAHTTLRCIVPDVR
jgi:hypothetical protein